MPWRSDLNLFRQQRVNGFLCVMALLFCIGHTSLQFVCSVLLAHLWVWEVCRLAAVRHFAIFRKFYTIAERWSEAAGLHRLIVALERHQLEIIDVPQRLISERLLRRYVCWTTPLQTLDDCFPTSALLLEKCDDILFARAILQQLRNVAPGYEKYEENERVQERVVLLAGRQGADDLGDHPRNVRSHSDVVGLGLRVFWEEFLEDLHLALRLPVNDRACNEKIQRPRDQMGRPVRIGQALVQERQPVVFFGPHEGKRLRHCVRDVFTRRLWRALRELCFANSHQGIEVQRSESVRAIELWQSQQETDHLWHALLHTLRAGGH